MHWIIGGAALAAFLLVTGNWPSSLPNPLSPTKVKAGGPGPAAQIAGNSPQAGTIAIGPITLGIPQSPQAVLNTINGVSQIANGALNQLDQLSQYQGSNNDSEYPIQSSFVAPTDDFWNPTSSIELDPANQY